MEIREIELGRAGPSDAEAMVDLIAEHPVLLLVHQHLTAIGSDRRRRHAEAAVAEAFRRGADSRLFTIADWEAMLDWPLDEVRRTLGVSDPPPYQPIPPTGEAPRPGDLVRGALLRDPVPYAA